MQGEYILEIENITKTFPGVVALDSVQLKVRPGTVHAVMGENGAGKSTLMKILFGIYQPDGGSILFKGEPYHCDNPNEALKHGIAMIHQELSGIRGLTVAENIFLGKELTYGKSPLLNRREMSSETQRLMDRLSIKIDPKAKMGSLSVAQQQLCELVKAVSYNADLIIMDEPTSAMTSVEVKHLFSIISELKANGIAIIYITHKMDEIYQVADEVSVYRDGKYIGSSLMTDISIDQLVEMMVGRSITQMFPKVKAPIGEEVLRIEGLTCKGYARDVSLTLHRGEILGLAGLVGAGRSETMEAFFGIRPKSAGKIFIHGKEVKINSPKDAIKNGVAMLTEDRKFNGCVLPMSVGNNIVLATLKQHSKGPFIDRAKCKISGEKMREALAIKTPSLQQKLLNLSGGNQQKALVAKWLLTKPEILIFDEPTRGIDVGSKSEIHKMLSNLANEGKSIILISSEMPEIMGMSDRIIVMHEGDVTGELLDTEANQEKILLFASGQTQENHHDSIDTDNGGTAV